MRTVSILKIGCGLVLLTLICLAFETIQVIKRLFPEVEMVLNSKCNSPAPGWNGKLLGFKVSARSLAAMYAFLAVSPYLNCSHN